MSGTLPRTGEGVIDHDQVIASRANDLAAQPPFALSELDVRRKHDSLVTFILGRGVMRRATRVVVLLALDFVGVMGAIYTALLLKSLLHGDVNFATAWHGTDSCCGNPLPLSPVATPQLRKATSVESSR